MKKVCGRVARLLAVAYGCLNLFACVIADRMLFMPPEASYTADDEDFAFFADRNGKPVAGFYSPPAEPDGPVLLWAHGNAEDAGNVRSLGRSFGKRGIGFLSYDYAGYGLTGGKPSEQGTYRSADAAVSYLTEKKGHSPEKIFLVGQSVGGGPSTYLAEKGTGGGLILISPFKSAFRVVTKVKIVPWDRFDNWKRMANIKQPLLLIHGDADEIVPFSHGEALYAAHPGPKAFLRLPGIGHNDLWPRAGKQVEDAIADFVTAPPAR